MKARDEHMLMVGVHVVAEHISCFLANFMFNLNEKPWQ